MPMTAIEASKAKTCTHASGRRRQPVDEGIDADVQIAPRDRDRPGENPEDHQEQHQLLGPAERLAENVPHEHVCTVDGDDAHQARSPR